MLAATPPMGWNSWDCFGTTVTEDEVLANARFLRDRLLPHGWDTVVVDIQWYEPEARAGGYRPEAVPELDAWGRQLPAVNRFPSAAGGRGFAPLAAAVHAMGLRFGLHVMRGIPRHAVQRDLPVLGTDLRASDVADTSSTCAWNPDDYGLDHAKPGAQAYVDAQVAQFAEWGVDLIKADDMLAPFHDAEIAAYRRAIDRSGRPMVLSLSPGTALSTARVDALRASAQMWRISDDLWDDWGAVAEQFARLARWAPHQRPGGWADADMLPIGRIGVRAERGVERDSALTLDEQRSMLTLWVLGRSPLMLGGDLPRSREDTIALLTNDDVLEVLRASTGNQEALREGDLVVWTARRTDGPGGWAAVFWLGDAPARQRVPLGSLGADPGAPRLRELWSGRDAPVEGGAVEVAFAAHDCRLFAV